MKTHLLVVGYGNELRRDDGVGPKAARAVARLMQPGLRGVAVHQLTSELAGLMAEAACVVFVDANRGAQQGIRTRLLQPARTASAIGHVCDPRELLALTEALYGRHPAAWLITVPAVDLDFGEGLSPPAEHGLEAALKQIDLMASGVDTGTQERQQCTKLD